jgi:hypothetical protein
MTGTAQDETRRPWTSTGSSGTVDDEDLSIVNLNNFVVGFATGATGTVNVRYNITAVDGISAFNPAGSAQISVRFRDSDNSGTDAQVLFTIRRSNVLTGGNEVVFTFDSNAQPPGGVAFHTETLCQTIDFDFSQYTYWIEAEVTRTNSALLVQLGSIRIREYSGPGCVDVVVVS